MHRNGIFSRDHQARWTRTEAGDQPLHFISPIGLQSCESTLVHAPPPHTLTLPPPPVHSQAPTLSSGPSPPHSHPPPSPPTLPGSYSQQWTLSTSPLLPDWRPLTVTARGLCLPEDCTSVERAALEEDVREKEKMAKVRA